MSQHSHRFPSLARACLAACSLAGPLASHAAPAQQQAATATLAQEGRALLPVVIRTDATPRVRAAAQELAKYLGRISGGQFQVEESAGPLSSSTTGLAVGVAGQFGEAAKALQTSDPTKQEDYILRTHARGVVLAGASELAVEHAVWDFLHRLGYRQFFPGEKWEFVPRTKNLSLSLDTLQHPDYYARNVWFDFGVFPENKARYAQWQRRNREAQGLVLNTGHAYQTIIKRNQAAFNAHPEFRNNPGSSKFCISNAALRKLVVEDALRQLEKNPSLQSISVDPSDGENWDSSTCPDDKVYKSVTDRVVTLANEVAEAVEAKHPGKLVGIYAYNVHSPAPTISVRPNVVVSIATSFIHGGFTLEQLLDGWSEKAKILGIREYYSVNTWDRDLPGKASGGNPKYLGRTLPHFHQKGARFLNSQASDNWGPNGLGYYLAARLMWDVDESKNLDALQADFLSKAFGTARAPMAGFYELIDSGHKPLLSADLVGRMYSQLDAAFQATDDPAVRARLHDLTLYTRYVELYMAYAGAEGTPRQAAFEAMMRFAWRVRGTAMVHTYGLWRDLVDRDKSVKFPAGSGLHAKGDPWKSDEPFGPEQVQRFIAEGIANNPRIGFEAKSFSQDLVPATRLGLRSGKLGRFYQLRGTNDLYTWVEKAPSSVALQASAGLIYANRGAASFTLFPKGEATGASVATVEVAPDKQQRPVELKSSYTGLHRISLRDSGASTTVSWPEGTPMTLEPTLQSPVGFAGGRWSLYFYVPRGTKVVGGYRGKALGQVVDAEGQVAREFERPGRDEYWSVPVPPGQDGKLWKLDNIVGRVTLMTVPPYLARSADELLLPREVVEAEAPR